jgi:diketogulonate reductase-like aldo/keto reductase
MLARRVLPQPSGTTKTALMNSVIATMPGVIYGTAWKKERTAHLVSKALHMGFRGIDTACQPKHYNEAGVGDGVAAWIAQGGTRAELYLQTKFTPLSGQDPHRVPYDVNASLAEQVAQSFQTSLRNLQTSYLDALVMHSPLSTFNQTLQAWRAMEAIVDEGDVTRLGISNCYDVATLKALFRSVRVSPAVVQNRFYEQTNYDVSIRAFCREHGIVYQSFWTLSANRHLLASPVTASLARKYERSPAQILFRYVSQESIVPLTGTASPDHMRESLTIFEFALNENEREAIGALL